MMTSTVVSIAAIANCRAANVAAPFIVSELVIPATNSVAKQIAIEFVVSMERIVVDRDSLAYPTNS